MEIILNTAYSFKQKGHRPNQEDARFPDRDVADGLFFVVCDGVGGNVAGEVASQTVSQCLGQSIGEVLANGPFSDDVLSNVLMKAYNGLRKARRTDTQNMATTMTMLVFHTAGVTMSHIGDSRIYQFRKEEGIHYRSKDHSLVQELVSIGKLTDEQARNHPRSNLITRSMSANATDYCPATTYATADIMDGDVFLLCTDGVWSECTDDELTELFLSDAPDRDIMQRLSEMCRDSDDNNTATMVRVAQVIRDADDEDSCTPAHTIDVAPKRTGGWAGTLANLVNKILK